MQQTLDLMKSPCSTLNILRLKTSSLRRRLADLSTGGSDAVEILIRESKSKVL